MGLFTHFTDRQAFSKITGCQLVQKNRRSKRSRSSKGCRFSKRCRRSTHNAIQRPIAEPDLPRQRAVEAVAGGGEAVEEGGEERRGGDEAVV